MKKRYLIGVIAAVTAAVLSAVGSGVVFAAPSEKVPTLFHNDEAWYKDETAPALLKDGIFHVPSDLIAMFDYITVTTERNGENLLFVNGQTGDYVSVLYSSRAACVNGTVLEDISIFRENGYYYLDADVICSRLGLSVEYSREANITDRSVRIYDSEKMASFDDLLSVYAKEEAETEGETIPPEEETAPPAEPNGERVAKIRLICAAGEESEKVLAWSLAERLGFSCELFLTSELPLYRLREVDGGGFAGLSVSVAEEAEEINNRLSKVFFRKSHLVLSTGDETEDETLRRWGYLVLTPDFTVDETTDADVMLREITAHLGEHDTAVVFLGDVWQSETLLLRLAALDSTRYDVGKIDGIN